MLKPDFNKEPRLFESSKTSNQYGESDIERKIARRIVYETAKQRSGTLDNPEETSSCSAKISEAGNLKTPATVSYRFVVAICNSFSVTDRYFAVEARPRCRKLAKEQKRP